MGDEAYRRLFVHAPVGIFRVEGDDLVSVNPALAQMLGYDSPEDLLSNSSTLGRLFGNVDVTSLRRHRANRGITHTEHKIECHRKDGSSFPGQLRLIDLPGESDETGVLEGYLFPRQAEEGQTEEANYTASPGKKEKLTRILAHDFNNILSAMLLRLELLGLDPDLDARTKENLAELEIEASRARFLARHLVTLSGCKRAIKPQALDLNKLINDILMRIKPLLGESADFKFEPCAEETWITGESTSVEDLITHLCLYTPHHELYDGELILKTNVVNFDAGSTQTASDRRPGNYVCLSLTETWKCTDAMGAAADDVKRQELAMLPVEEFARQYHGWVEADQSGWDGFVIRVFLPAKEVGAGTTGDDRPEESQAARETILLVEDELTLRRATALSLRKLGYAVLEAGDEKEALQISQKHPTRIDALFTDMMMTSDSITGLDLAKKIREKNHALKVIVASGYGIAGEEDAILDGEDFILLTKPYDAAEVAKMVQECLRRQPQKAD